MAAPLPIAVSPDDHDQPAEPVEGTSIKDRNERVVGGILYRFNPKQLYTAHGKWAWANDEHFHSLDRGIRLGCHVVLKTSYINEQKVVYISKMTSVWGEWRLFFSSLYLFASSKYLRPLQGDCVPWIIGVRHCAAGRVGVAQDLPHPKGWREADMFLEESQKEAVIAAYQKLHDRGILHGRVEYRHILIGDDGKVTIINFGFSRVVDPDEWARKCLPSCSPLCLRNEMRKVKFLLNWKDSRETEPRLAKLRNATEEQPRIIYDTRKNVVRYSREEIEAMRKEMAEELEVQPDGGLRLSDVTAWSSGDPWKAHRLEVIELSKRVSIKVTRIPHPSIPAEKTTGKSMDPVPPVVPVAVDPGPATTQMPAIDPGAIDRPPAPTSSSGERPLDMEQTMVLDEQANEQKDRSLERVNAVIARSPTRKRSLGEESETAPEGRTSVNGKGKAVARESDDINEPARKRQRTTEESATPTPISTPNHPAVLPKQPLVTELHDFGSVTPSNPPARMQVVEEFLPTDDFNGPTMSNASSSETDANDSMKVPLLGDDAADPTPYELSPEARAFLLGEAARGFARFVTANTRVQPLERQLDQENRNLEMRRSELLRVMLMLPREDRTTIWTNMGQPDARTLLGLLPEPSSSIKRSSDVQNQVGRTEDASSSSSSRASVPNSSALSHKSNQGFLEVQKVQAKASSKQKLQSRLQMERDKDSEAMPPPRLPVIRSAGTSQRPSIARLSQRRHGSSSQRPRSSASTAPEQSGSSTREHPYCAQLRQAMDNARKAHGVFSFSVSPEILAWEGRSTRKYPYPTPTGRAIARTPTPHTRITELTGVPELKVIKSPWKEFEAKRKREDTGDSQALVPAADVEQRDPKRRKTEKCDTPVPN